MEKSKNILETKDELETILEPKEEVKPEVKKAKKSVKPVSIPMEDMQAHYEDRVRNSIDIMTIPYTKAYEMIRGYAASVMFSGVTYSFKVGFATPILREHYQLVFDWLNETHKASGAPIESNTEALAMTDAKAQG